MRGGCFRSSVSFGSLMKYSMLQCSVELFRVLCGGIACQDFLIFSKVVRSWVSDGEDRSWNTVWDLRLEYLFFGILYWSLVYFFIEVHPVLRLRRFLYRSTSCIGT